MFNAQWEEQGRRNDEGREWLMADVGKFDLGTADGGNQGTADGWDFGADGAGLPVITWRFNVYN